MLQEAPARLSMPLNGRFKFTLPGDARETPAKVLGLNRDALLVEVLAECEDWPELEGIRLTYASENVVWEVETRVLAHFDRWWFLERPLERDVARFQRRNAERIPFSASTIAMPVDMVGAPCGAPVTLDLTDLSADGCHAFCEEAFAKGTRLLIYLKVPDIATATVIGEIVREQLGERSHGIHFIQVPRPLRDKIAAFVSAQLASGSPSLETDEEAEPARSAET
jgi:hypothetical protein